MFNIHGRTAFEAEEAGASSVTGVDIMGPTPEYLAEHERRNSRARYVHGDLHDPALVGEIGIHDVVWCTGVIYHSPNPLTLMQRFAEMCRETLVLGSLT